MTAKTKPAPATDLEFTITRIFDAPRALVFSMWTEQRHVTRWSCPHGFTMQMSEEDVRTGGTWRSHMRSAGGEDFRLQGVYREVVENERLVFTQAWVDENGKAGPETLVTVTFTDQGGKTRMIFQQTGFDSTASRDGHERGMTECFDRLAGVLAALSPKDIAQ